VTPAQAHSNLFLLSLPAKELAALTPHLRRVALNRGDVLSEPGEPVNDVLFVESGTISLLTPMHDGSAVETATVGRESILGVLGALGSHRSSSRAVVQIAGHASRMEVNEFRDAVDHSRILRQVVLLSSELTLAHMQQTAACNALHGAERRLCRWILQVRDHIDTDVVQLTHDFLAQMLAVRRPTVSLIAQELQKAGLIRYKRGRITILNRGGLEKMACECLGSLRDRTRETLGALARPEGEGAPGAREPQDDDRVNRPIEQVAAMPHGRRGAI